MLILRSDEISLARPVRMLHPRLAGLCRAARRGLFMVGATMIENEERARVTRRSRRRTHQLRLCGPPAFAEGGNCRDRLRTSDLPSPTICRVF
jgi:glycine oxidase